ncbi:polysaccharide pyruvyl transferase family protein [Butyrivibrio sp. FC2001]|uniref:polysaccharide pyruvyl transferase family protein n=1 Tax=Butyrivibrio sp. FC2001 TaxID=1280671 RepID=UPI00040FB6A2|nr:polysaccharide pyruvyl transferase family protein [Butyrivibrio sp. FC2001]
MKVAVITFYNNNNYGSVLQMYALTKYIESKGHDVCVFDFLNMNVPVFRLLRVKTAISRFFGLVKVPSFFRYRSLSIEDNIMMETREKYQEFYSTRFDYYSQKYKRLDDVEMYVAGSDQVWNIQIPNLHYVFFMRFIGRNKRMSYAASFGSDHIPQYNRKRLKKYLSEIDNISVRETTGVNIVEDVCGKEAKVVLDPVLLVGRDFWDKRACNVIQGKYVFCYFLDKSDLINEAIDRISAAYHGKVSFVYADTGVQIDNCVKQSLSPFEFIGAIKEAEFVLTDSFHATAFSLLFGKKFYVLERQYKIRPEQADRIISILRSTNTNNRYICNSSDFDRMRLDTPYDIEYINDFFQKERISSELYLQNAISGKTEKNYVM